MGWAAIFCGALTLAFLLAVLPAPPARALDTFTVDSVADTGDADPDGVCGGCTLREAIEEANANGNPAEVDRISFDIPGPGAQTIAPASALPAITEPVIVDGYTQPGTSPNTTAVGDDAVLKIVLDGIGVSGNGLQISGASGSVIRGLVIKRFGLAGIVVSGGSSRSRIEGNFVGTNRYGTLAPGNGGDGVILSVNTSTPDKRNVISATGDEISRNSIFSNGGLGIDLRGVGEGYDTDIANPNDPGDTDFAANNLQNNPLITSATTASGTTTIQATLDGMAGETYTIEFYSNPSGTNEGRKFIGEYLSVANSGFRSFTYSPEKAVSVGQTITATATSMSTHDTSEFSAPQTVGST